MKRIGSIVGILLVIGLLLGLAPPALAAVDIGQAVPLVPLLDNGPGKDKGKAWHLGKGVTVVKGKALNATLENTEIIRINLEDGKVIEVGKDAIKGPIKSRIWGGIEHPKALEGSVIVALVYKDGNVYIAKHVAIIPGRTFAHYCGNVTDFTPCPDEGNDSITIKPAKLLVDGDKLTFTITERTKFLPCEPEVGDRVTVIARKPYEEGMAALAVVSCWKPPLPPKVIKLEGTITDILNSTITLDVDDESQLITYDDETIFVIRGATSLEIHEEVTVIALERGDEQLLAKGIFAGLEPAYVMQWLERHRVQWSERHGIPWLERLRNQWFERHGVPWLERFRSGNQNS